MVAISIEKVELKATNDRFSHQTVRIGTSENNDNQNDTNTAISIVRQYNVYTIYTHIHVSDTYTYTYNIIIYIYSGQNMVWLPTIWSNNRRQQSRQYWWSYSDLQHCYWASWPYLFCEWINGHYSIYTCWWPGDPKYMILIFLSAVKFPQLL